MSYVKFFAMQDGQLAGWINTTHYIDPYDAHIDQSVWGSSHQQVSTPYQIRSKSTEDFFR